jgi:peptidoglycan hydrolase-like protein with peptidoglycan-binding domain
MMRHLVVATSAALISLGAVAGGGQQQSQSREGTEASIVREAQDKLRAEGYAATPQGLREFQQAKGLEAHGKLDQQTLAALGVDTSAASGASSEPAPRSGERPKY